MAALCNVHAGKLLRCQSAGLLLGQREQQLEPESICAVEVVPAAGGATPLKDLLILAASDTHLQQNACMEGDGLCQLLAPAQWRRLASGQPKI